MRILNIKDITQGSTNCAILTSRMEEHGVSWENMENMKKKDINQMT